MRCRNSYREERGTNALGVDGFDAVDVSRTFLVHRDDRGSATPVANGAHVDL